MSISKNKKQKLTKNERPNTHPGIEVIDYDSVRVEERREKDVHALLSLRHLPTVTWINVEGAQDAASMKELSDLFELHPLVIQDITDTDQRPKFEDFVDYIYLSLKMLSYNEQRQAIDIESVSLVLGKNFLISFQGGQTGDVFGPIRERIRKGDKRIRSSGNDYLLYALMSTVIEHYFVILEKIGERIEETEDFITDQASHETLKDIHRLKRELVYVRKCVWPLREVLVNLQHVDSELVTEGTDLYIRDLYEQTVQLIETAETFRDVLSGMMDMYLSTINNQMNAVMKVLAVISTIFMPLTFIAGIYGMNFRHMPELDVPWAYPLVLLLMFAIGATMFTIFKRKNWF